VSGQAVRVNLPALLLLASLALLPAHTAVAQERESSPSAHELRDEYPLRSTPEPGSGDAAGPAAPAATAEPSGRPPVVVESSATDLRLVIAAVLAILAFVAGFAIALRPLRRRGGSQDADRVAVTPPTFATVSGSRRAAAAPPAPHRAWTAEVEWRAAGGEACFSAVARPAEGAGTAVIAESDRLEWPPMSAAAVAALTAAAEDLETRMVAAGWRPLAPGDAWYAKRFEWEPVGRMPAARGRFDRAERISDHIGRTT
jgi:hypothetical protein